MTIHQIFARFPNQESCIRHLEKVRFGDEPYCPLCGVVGHVARKADGNRIGRWNCHSCKASFNVLSGTIFQNTKLQLQDWFFAIGLVMHAKKSLSSHQLGRDLGMNHKSAWYMQQRIRAEMARKEGFLLLQGIVEADETYVGGRKRSSTPPPPERQRNKENAGYRRR